MLNIGKIYEGLFNSFRIEGIETLIQTLKGEEITECMIVKRSWIFGFYVSGLLLCIVGTLLVQIFLIAQYSFIEYVTDYILTAFMLLNIIYVLYASVLYLLRFHATYKNGNQIRSISIAENHVGQEAQIFSGFFNQITFSYIVFIFLALVEISYLLFVSKDYTNPRIWIQIISLILQIGLIAYYRRRIIDLHMDYVVIIPGRLYFMDQIGIHRSQQTIKLMKDILIIRGGYPNLIASFLGYGTIEMSVKFDREISTYDTPNILDMLHMHYVLHPIETANDMNKLLSQENLPRVM